MKPRCFNHFGWLPACVLFAVVSCASAPAAGAQSATGNPPRRPLPRRANLILIVADGLGCGDLSCYGQTNFQTPELDRLAKGGIRFTNFYAGDAASPPAFAALLLGKNSAHLPQRAGADVSLAAGDATLARVLKNSGYHTGYIGEWDLGDESTGGAPWKQGFEEFAGYLAPRDGEKPYADFMWRFAPRSLPHPTSGRPPGFVGKETIYANTGNRRIEYIPDLLTKAALNFVRNNQPDPFNHYRPFFLMLHYRLPGAGDPVVPTDAPYSEEPWPQPERDKAAAIARLDSYIGRLLQQLDKIGQTSNTVIFFTSDTGPVKSDGVDPAFFKSAGPFRGGRGHLREGGLRVPLIVRWPGRFPAGRVSGLPCAAWDVLPTATDIALIAAPARIDGVSFERTLTGRAAPARREFFYWQLNGVTCVEQAARLGDWKIFRARTGAKWELYNLKTDPGEAKNVAEKNTAVLAKFQRRLSTP